MKRMLVQILVVLCALWATAAFAGDTTGGSATYQPDAMIRNHTDQVFVGERLILDASQAVSQTGAGPFMYVVRVANTSSVVDAISLKSTKLDGWTILFGMPNPNGVQTDISADVCGNGKILELAAGKSVDITVKLEPGATIKTDTTVALPVYTISTKDTSKADKLHAKATVKTETTTTLAYKPDAMIRNNADNTFIGENIFTEAAQTKVQSALAGPFIFVIRVKNAGTATDTICVKSNAAAEGWTVKYAIPDANGTLTDVTGDVTGGKFQKELAAGKNIDLTLKIEPGATVKAGTTLSMGIIATSGKDDKKIDIVRANAAIATPVKKLTLASPENGATGVGLTAEFKWNTLEGYTVYAIQIANDEKFTTPIIMQKSLTATTFRAPIGALKLNTKYWWRVSPGSGTTYNSTCMSETWSFTTTAGEAAPYKPDAYLRSAGDATYFVGENVFNADALNQVKSVTTSTTNPTAGFVIRVMNRGTKADAIRILATSGNTEWSAKYVCFGIVGGDGAGTGTDITAKITTTGFAETLQPGAVLEIGLTVTPAATLPVNAYRNFLVQVKSGVDNTKCDAVRATAVQGKLPAPPKFTVTATPATGAQAGQPVKLTATGLTGSYEYKFFIGRNNSWTLLRTYTTDAGATWTPKEAGVYNILCWARLVGSVKDWEVNATLWQFVVGSTTPRASLVAAPATGAKVGATVTLSAQVSGIKKPEYAFYVSNGSGWTLLRAYGTTASTTWQPKLAGKYALAVYVREQGSNATYQLSGLIKEYVVNAK
jgi:uncharacterized membrane protein